MESPGQAGIRQAEFDKLNFDKLKFGKLKSERMWLRHVRFEIIPRGGIVILVGLLGLLATVTLLGTISEREMAPREQGQSQLSNIYSTTTGAPSAPLPHAANPAELPATPVAAGTPESPLRAAIASENMSPAAPPKPPPWPKAPPHPALVGVPPEHQSASAAEEPHDSSLVLPDSLSPTNKTGAHTRNAVASAPPPSARTDHAGYRILIAAAMDRSVADRMASRLLGLGYTSYVMPSEVNGPTWYRVQVGPYPTPAAARAARTKLQADYIAHYINRTD
jgi:septal ring-binding cell division protein DamX